MTSHDDTTIAAAERKLAEANAKVAEAADVWASVNGSLHYTEWDRRADALRNAVRARREALAAFEAARTPRLLTAEGACKLWHCSSNPDWQPGGTLIVNAQRLLDADRASIVRVLEHEMGKRAWGEFNSKNHDSTLEAIRAALKVKP